MSPFICILKEGYLQPAVQKVWLVLEEKSIPYQYIEVNPYHKPTSLLELNPRGLVPTLQYEGKPLYESTVICEFLEDAFPNHGLRILPIDPYAKARMRIWTDFVTTRIVPSYFRFLQNQPEQTQNSMEKVRSEFLDSLRQFAEAMDDEGPFFMGKEPTLVDFVMAPWGVRLWALEKMKGGLGLPKEGEGGLDEKSWARWRNWMAAVEDRKSVRETTSEKKHYMPIYQR